MEDLEEAVKKSRERIELKAMEEVLIDLYQEIDRAAMSGETSTKKLVAGFTEAHYEQREQIRLIQAEMNEEAWDKVLSRARGLKVISELLESDDQEEMQRDPQETAQDQDEMMKDKDRKKELERLELEETQLQV